MKKASLKELARDKILGLLLEGEIRPGDMINRREVAARFGMSPAPVHEAMLQLEADGILKAAPRKGTIVIFPNPSDISELFVLREALECQAARIYCGEKIKSRMNGLLKTARELDRKTDGSPAARFEGEVRLHSELVALAGNRRLSEIFDKTMRLTMLAMLHSRRPSKKISSPHDRLLLALATPDPDKAEAVIRSHVTKYHGNH